MLFSKRRIVSAVKNASGITIRRIALKMNVLARTTPRNWRTWGLSSLLGARTYHPKFFPSTEQPLSQEPAKYIPSNSERVNKCAHNA